MFTTCSAAESRLIECIRRGRGEEWSQVMAIELETSEKGDVRVGGRVAQDMSELVLPVQRQCKLSFPKQINGGFQRRRHCGRPKHLRCERNVSESVDDPCAHMGGLNGMQCNLRIYARAA